MKDLAETPLHDNMMTITSGTTMRTFLHHDTGLRRCRSIRSQLTQRERYYTLNMHGNIQALVKCLRSARTHVK